MEQYNADLGDVFAVIYGNLKQIKVSAVDLRASLDDPLIRNPMAYWFEWFDNRTTIPFQGRHKIAVSVSKDVAAHPPKQRHAEAVRFGLREIASHPNRDEFFLTSDQVEQMSAQQLEGPDLRRSLLDFMLAVHWIQPDDFFNCEDLYLVLNADKDRISDWLENLHREELLDKKKKSVKSRLENVTLGGLAHYALNPKRRDAALRESSGRSEREATKGGNGARPFYNFNIVEIEPDRLSTGFIFCMTEFRGQCMKRFKDFIKPLGRKLGCPIVISSEDERQNPISDVIISHIQKCKFAIADFSTRNPNVMYEIGFAHAINKKVIPICSMRRSKPRVFDIQDIPTLYFNSHKKLAADLERRARTLLKSTQ